MPFCRSDRRLRLGPLTNFIEKPWCMRRMHLFLVLAALLVIACGGTGKTNRLTGVYYQVKPGDTLSKIAKAYQISPRKLAEANNIQKPYQLLEYTVIFIPYSDNGAEWSEAPPVAAPQKEIVRRKVDQASRVARPETNAQKEAPPVSGAPALKKDVDRSVKDTSSPPVRKKPVSQPLWKTPSVDQEGGRPVAERNSLQESTAAAKRAGVPLARPEGLDTYEKGMFFWPVKGKVANRFGLQPNGMYYNHLKIITKENAAISAAAAGTVIFSAPLKEFGETIIVKHDHRFATVYTHLGTRLAKVDHRVRKGEQIGLAGKTETKNVGCVYFEIRDHNKSRNPLLFLP